MWSNASSGLDIVELDDEVRRAVGEATRQPDGQLTDDVRWYLNLREVCGRALRLYTARSNADAWHDESRDALETEVLLSQLGSGGVKSSVLDVIPALRDLDDELVELGDRAASASREGDAEYREAVRRPLDDCIQRATAKLEEWLGVPPKRKKRLEWGAGGGQVPGELAVISDRTRGPDVEPRKRRASVPKPPPPTKEQKAAARAALRVTRVVALLRRQHPDGLSANAIKRALRMGDEQAREAIRAALAVDAILLRGFSLENSKYYAPSGLPEKRPGKRSRLKE